MKKLLFISSALVLFSSNALAQRSFAYRKVLLGPRIGINLSTLSADPDLDKPSTYRKAQIPGFLFGGVVSIGVNKILSFQPEILFSQKGKKYIDGDDYTQQTANYLEVPLLTKFSAGGREFRGFINLGPYLGYWLSKKTKMVVDGKVVAVSESADYFDDDIEDGIADNRLDIGLSIGGGFAVRIGPGYLIFDVGYELGLTDITKYKEDRYKPDPYTKVSNRTIGISAGYLFELGGWKT